MQEQILMHRWRYPSLSLHGIEGAFSEAGAKTVIPRKVIGKFSIRLVPDMDPKVVEKQVWSFFLKSYLMLYHSQVICILYRLVLQMCLCWNVLLFLQVITHLESKFAELKSPNKLKVYMGHGAKAWVSDFNHPHYMAGRKAMKTGKT